MATSQSLLFPIFKTEVLFRDQHGNVRENCKLVLERRVKRFAGFAPTDMWSLFFITTFKWAGEMDNYVSQPEYFSADTPLSTMMDILRQRAEQPDPARSSMKGSTIEELCSRV